MGVPCKVNVLFPNYQADDPPQGHRPLADVRNISAEEKAFLRAKKITHARWVGEELEVSRFMPGDKY